MPLRHSCYQSYQLNSRLSNYYDRLPCKFPKKKGSFSSMIIFSLKVFRLPNTQKLGCNQYQGSQNFYYDFFSGIDYVVYHSSRVSLYNTFHIIFVYLLFSNSLLERANLIIPLVADISVWFVFKLFLDSRVLNVLRYDSL